MADGSPHLSVPQSEIRYLTGPIAPGWFVLEPLQIRVEPDETGEVVVSDDQFAVYGVGADRDSAIADYTASLIEYYELIEQESRDHSPTAALFHSLQRVITRRVL